MVEHCRERPSSCRCPAWLLWAFVALGGVSGCRTTAAPPPPAITQAPAHGDVGMSLLAPPPGAPRLELPRNQGFVFPNLLRPVDLPGYPPALLARRLPPLEVCVDVDIDTAGVVTATHLRGDAGCTTGEGEGLDAFVDAGLAAPRGWRYAPALLCIAPAPVEDPCWHPQVEERPTAIRMSYVFRFSQRDGTPVVEMGGG